MSKELQLIRKGIRLKSESSALSYNEKNEGAIYNKNNEELRTQIEGVDREILTDSQTQAISNKTLDNTNAISVKDGNLNIQDADDVTKQVQFDLSNITTATTRTIIVPDVSDTIVTIAATQTLSSKSIDADSNIISNLEVDNLKAGVLDTDLTTVSLSDDTLASAKAIKTALDLKTDDTSFSLHTTATSVHGVTGNIVGTSDTQTLTAKTIDADSNTISNLEVGNLKSGVLDTDLSSVSLNDDTLASAKAIKTALDLKTDGTAFSSHTSATVAHGVSGDIVGTTDDQTLTSKTIDADSNTISNLEVNNLKTGVLDTDLTSVSLNDDTLASAKAIKTALDLKTDTTSFSSHTTATTAHGVSGSIVGTSDAQTLTNKTFDDSIVIKELSSTPSTPSSGYKKIYPKDDGKLYTLNSSGTEVEVGSGSGGGGVNPSTNYLATKAPAVEWTAYSSGTTSPVTSFGTASYVSVSDNTTTPLRGASSLRLSKSANAAQGEGIYTEFTLESADLSSVIRLVGDARTSTNYADEDVGFFLCFSDDSFSTFETVEFSPVDLLAGAGSVLTEIQTIATKTQVRFCIHVRSTSALAYDVDFELGLGKVSVVSGQVQAPVGSIIPFASAVTPKGFYLKCDGSAVSRTAYKELFDVIGTTYGAGDGSTTFNLPDYTGRFLRGLGGNSAALGVYQADDFKSHTHIQNAHNHTTAIRTYEPPANANVNFNGITINSFLMGGSNYGTGFKNTTNTCNSTTATNQNTGGTETRPQNMAVVFWISYKDTMVLSEDVSGREISGSMYSNASTPLPTGSSHKILFTNTTLNKGNLVDLANSRFVVPESGTYSIGFKTVIYNATDTAGWTGIGLRKNGVPWHNIGIKDPPPHSTVTFESTPSLVPLVKGDIIEVYVNPTVITLTFSDAYFNAYKINSGSQHIAASEKVSVYATNTSGLSIANSGTVVTSYTKVNDTHGAFDATTGIFTCPRSGYLSVDFGTRFTAGGDGWAVASIYIDGVLIKEEFNSSHTPLIPANVSIRGYPVSAGSQVNILIRHSSESNLVLGVNEIISNLGITIE